MATERVTGGLPLNVVSTLDKFSRDQDRLQHRYEQLEERVRALLVLQEVANTLTAELNLTPLLRRIAVAAVRLTSAQVSIVYLVHPSGSSLSVQAIETAETAMDSGAFSTADLALHSQPGWIPEEESLTVGPSIGIDAGVAGYAATTGSLILVNESQVDPRFDRATIDVDARLLGVEPTALLAVPMIFSGTVSGVLEVAHSDHSSIFDASTLDLVRTLAAQAATAVENAQLYRRLRSERDRIIQAQEDERKRLGRDLHDGPAQRLAQIVMSLEYAEKLVDSNPAELRKELASIREFAGATTREIRNLLFDLRPLVLDAENGGLVVALRHFLERFKTNTSPRMHLTAEYRERLSHNVELTVFAIMQEAANNTIKHANASNCWIEVRDFGDKLVATVRDDGAGFDVQKLQDEYESRGSWGLLNMAERASLIEAKLNIASQPGRGTVVSLELLR
ncbi:MAG: histidine kinase [Ktedonobacterales bacterium]